MSSQWKMIASNALNFGDMETKQDKLKRMQRFAAAIRKLDQRRKMLTEAKLQKDRDNELEKFRKQEESFKAAQRANKLWSVEKKEAEKQRKKAERRNKRKNIA